MLLEEAYPVDEAQRACALSAADLPMPWTTGAALSSAVMLSACGGGSVASPASAVPPVPAGPETTATPGTTTTTGSGGTTTTGTAGTPTTTTTGGGSTTTTTTTTTTAGGTATTATTATTSTATATATTTGAGVTVVTGSTGSTTSPTVTPTPSPPVTVTAAAVTPVQASRFLAQATMGATRATIDEVVAKGYDGWLTAQFAMPRPIAHWDWLVAQGRDKKITENLFGSPFFDDTIWRALISDPDQLRQRVGMALLDIMALGVDGTNLNYRALAGGCYVDVLLDNAFGNYRQLLDAVTYSAPMGSFLTYYNNSKANPTTGSQPDENFARELMQLFTLGLYRLNMDGTIAGSTPTETYTQADVSGLARVFTGLTTVTADATTPDRIRPPMVMNASLNETGSASFLGTTVSGGGTAAIKRAVDTIFAHPNVPPFVSKQLIQRLVTSNPSPAYVGRVAAAFADNGAGVRGDMKAVIRAILLDVEARSDTALTAPMAGKLREPVMRLTAWARAFNVTSPSGAWEFGDTSSTVYRLGQAMGRSPSVFNWFRPGYTPPDTAIARAGMVGPEFQITNEQTVVAYVNYMQTLVPAGVGDTKPDYSALLAKAADSAALVDEINLVLAAGQLSATTVTAIRSAVDSIAATATGGPANRVNTAILLTLASPDFLTVK